MFSKIKVSLICLLLTFSITSYADYIVVINSDAGINEISAAELKRIYLKKVPVLPNGIPATIVGLKKGEAREGFLVNVLRKSEAGLNSYWSRLMFSGRAQPPRLFNNDAELIQFVSNTPGSIGYVDSETDLGDNIVALKIN